MKHYRAPNGEVYAYESDGSQDHLIPQGFVSMTDAEVEAHRASVQAAIDAAVPKFVKLAQARKALMRAGLFAAVDAAVKAPGNEEMLQDWEYGDVIRRDSVTVLALSQQLGITDTQLDDLFRLAATL